MDGRCEGHLRGRWNPRKRALQRLARGFRRRVDDIMVFEKFIRSAGLAVGLKPSATNAKPACAG